MARERSGSTITEIKEIQKSALVSWVKIVFRKAGIDTSHLKAYFCRSAATSKGKAMSISLEGVLQRGQWSGESTGQKIIISLFTGIKLLKQQF